MGTTYLAKGFNEGGDSKPYKVYNATIEQVGTNNPTSNILLDELNSAGWVRVGVGNYENITTTPYVANKIYMPGFGLRQAITFCDGTGNITGNGIFYFTDFGGFMKMHFQSNSSGGIVELSSISPAPIVNLPEVRVYI